MNETGTIHDAAAIFSALRGDQVIELLSRLETEDAQRLLATAAKTTPTFRDLEQASMLLRADINRPNLNRPNEGTASQKKKSKLPKQNPSRKMPKGSSTPRPKHSLDFLIDLADHDVRQLLKNVSTACWAPALQNESRGVQDAIFDNVAPAIERLLRQEIQSLNGNSQVARIARQKIIAAAHDLDLLETEPVRRKAG